MKNHEDQSNRSGVKGPHNSFNCAKTIEETNRQLCNKITQEEIEADFDTVEESLRNLLRNKRQNADCKKEDTEVQMAQYKIAIEQCRNHIQMMEDENKNLKNKISKLSPHTTSPQLNSPSDTPQIRLEDVVLHCTTLSDRIKKMEERNCQLVEDAEKQKCEYERCLDKVASQVVQALLTQRRLQTECSQLRTQVHRLAISNTPDESPSPPAHGYNAFESSEDPTADEISKFLTDLSSSLHSAGFSKQALTETLSNCPTLPMREPQRVVSPGHYVTSPIGPNQQLTPVSNVIIPTNPLYANHNPTQGMRAHSDVYPNDESPKHPSVPLHAIPESLEPRYDNGRMWGSRGPASYYPQQTSVYDHPNQTGHTGLVRSRSFDNHSYAVPTTQYNIDNMSIAPFNGYDNTKNNLHRRSLENISLNVDQHYKDDLSSNTQYRNTHLQQFQSYNNNISYENRHRSQFISLPNDVNANNNNSIFHRSFPSQDRGRNINRSRHLSPPQVRSRKSSTLSPPIHRRSRSHDVVIDEREVAKSPDRFGRSRRSLDDGNKSREKVWIQKSELNEPKLRLSTASSISMRSPNVQNTRKKFTQKSPTYADLPPPPPPPPQEEEPPKTPSTPTSPTSPRIQLSVWKDKSPQNISSSSTTTFDKSNNKSNLCSKSRVTFQDANVGFMETDFGEEIVTSLNDIPKVVKQCTPVSAQERGKLYKSSSRSETSLVKSFQESPKQEPTQESRTTCPIVQPQSRGPIARATSFDALNSKCGDNLNSNQPGSRLKKSRLATPSRLSRERSKSERIRSKSFNKAAASNNNSLPTSSESINNNVTQTENQTNKKSIAGFGFKSSNKSSTSNKDESRPIKNSPQSTSATKPPANKSNNAGKEVSKKKLSQQKSLVGLMKARFGKSSATSSSNTKKESKNNGSSVDKSEISSPIDFRTLSLEPNAVLPSSLLINSDKKISKQKLIKEQQGQIGRKLSHPLANSPSREIPEKPQEENEDEKRVQNFMNRQNSNRGKSGLRFKGKKKAPLSPELEKVELIPIPKGRTNNNSLDLMATSVEQNTNPYISGNTPSPRGLTTTIAIAKQKSASLDKERVGRRQNTFENVVVNKGSTAEEIVRTSKRTSFHGYENVVIVPSSKTVQNPEVINTKMSDVWKSLSNQSLSKESQSSHGSKTSLNIFGGNKSKSTQLNQQTSYEKAIISSIVKAELEQNKESNDTHDNFNHTQVGSGKSSANFSTTDSSKSGTSFDSWPSSSDDSARQNSKEIVGDSPTKLESLQTKLPCKIPSGSRSSLGSFGYGSGTSNSSSSSNDSRTVNHSHSANDISLVKKLSPKTPAHDQLPQSKLQMGAINATRKPLTPIRSTSHESKLKNSRLSRPRAIPTGKVKMGVGSIVTDGSANSPKPMSYKSTGGFGFSGVKSQSQGDVATQKLAPLSYGIPKPAARNRSEKSIAYSNPSYAQLPNTNMQRRYGFQKAEAF